jgi:hypothetical protein
LDNVKKIEVSCNQFDSVHMMKSSSHGVWLTIRGSPVLHLYDSNDLSCKLLINPFINKYYDISATGCLKNDYPFSLTRITCFFILNNLIWIGTGQGYLFIYSISSNNEMIVNRVIKTAIVETVVCHSKPPIVKKTLPPNAQSIINNNKKNLSKSFRHKTALTLTKTKSALQNDTNTPTIVKQRLNSLRDDDDNDDKDDKKVNNTKTISSSSLFDYKLEMISKAKLSDKPIKIVFQSLNKNEKEYKIYLIRSLIKIY